MYPNSIISLNISPETKVGMAYFKDGEVYTGNDEDKLKFVFSKNGLKYDLTRKQFYIFIKEMNFCVAPNGAVFSQDKEGVLCEYMREVFAQRSSHRSDIKSLHKENEKLKKELDELKKLLSNA